MLKSDSPAKLTVGTLGTVGTVGTHEPLLTVGLKTQDGGEERNGGMDSADSISTCRSWNYNKNTTKGGGLRRVHQIMQSASTCFVYSQSSWTK